MKYYQKKKVLNSDKILEMICYNNHHKIYYQELKIGTNLVIDVNISISFF